MGQNAMSGQTTRRTRRRRLSPEERDRLLAEIARYDQPPRPPRRVPKVALPPVPEETEAAIRAALTEGVAPDEGEAGLPRLHEPWDKLAIEPLDERTLERNLVITARRRNPAHAAFDVLRTRLLHALADNGWRRVGVTSPTRGCGKSFTSVNLAISLARYENRRTLLMDMDMRHPSLHRFLGLRPPAAMGELLRGEIEPPALVRRVAQPKLRLGPHLAVGLNEETEPFASELLQRPETARILDRLIADYTPDVVLYDLPPALAQDDVLSFSSQIDCVLMVVGGGLTTAAQVREVIRRLGEDKPIAGIVLNKAEEEVDYSY